MPVWDGAKVRVKVVSDYIMVFSRYSSRCFRASAAVGNAQFVKASR